MRDVMNTRGEGTEMTWVKPKWSKRQFELHEGDTIVATLVWGRGTRALARLHCRVAARACRVAGYAPRR